MTRLVSYYWHGDTLRSRSVSNTVLSGTVNIPALPARLLADWHRDLPPHLGVEPGDVDLLSLARARTRWPDYRQCVQAVTDWMATQGLNNNLIATAEVALMACRGARYHHDGAQYGGSAFCNLFLSEDVGLDVHFASTGHRIPLSRGTVVIFDTAQPHAVIDRNSTGFDAADFPPNKDRTQVFLTWELPIEHADVSKSLEIEFDIDRAGALRLDDEQVWFDGALASVCTASGIWRRSTTRST